MMSKLVVLLTTDVVIGAITRRANRAIKMKVEYNIDKPNKFIDIVVTRPDHGEYKNKIVIWVDGEVVKTINSPYKRRCDE